MTSDFSVPLSSSISKDNDYTKKIHKIFNQYWSTLENKRQAVIDGIDTWHRELEEKLQKRKDTQKARVNEHYNSLRTVLDGKYKENLDLAVAYYRASQDDLFKELDTACQSLTFQVATLEFVTGEMERPRVMIQDELLQVKPSDLDSRARRARRRNKNNNEAENSTTSNATPQADSSIVNPRQTVDEKSSEEKSDTKTNSTTKKPDNSNSQITSVGGSDKKCPICFMIFPMSMTSVGQQEHVNEHYNDD